MRKPIFVLLLLAASSLACTLFSSLSSLRVESDANAIATEVARQLTQTVAAQPFDLSNLGTIDADVTYCTIDGVDLKMDVYYPAHGNGPWPAVIYVHGGAWIGGDKASGPGTRFFANLVEAGYLVVSINYRLAPIVQFPAPIEDVKCAIRSLRANATRLNIDPNRIAIMGDSAGGQLASLAGLADESAGFDQAGGYTFVSSKVQAVISLFGPTDFRLEDCEDRVATLIFGASSCSDTQTLSRYSPIDYVSAAASPFLLIHGEKDDTVPLAHSQELENALQAVNVPVMLVVVQNAGHGFVQVGGPLSPTPEEIAQIVVTFLNQTLQG